MGNHSRYDLQKEIEALEGQIATIRHRIQEVHTRLELALFAWKLMGQEWGSNPEFTAVISAVYDRRRLTDEREILDGLLAERRTALVDLETRSTKNT